MMQTIELQERHPKDMRVPLVYEDSRNGPVIRIPGPVTITFEHPQERVLHNLGRDANPFFHFFEALWMLAGRNDVHYLTWFNKRMATFSDDGHSLYGAYGHRWRNQFQGMDQLKYLVRVLDDPFTRRAVLEMWSPMDLERVVNTPDCKDVPCNTHAYLELETKHPITDSKTAANYRGRLVPPEASIRVLNLTICNRSNDMLWGTFGANPVHFSIMQEYLAAHLGVSVGTFTVFSKNQHLYKAMLTPDKWRSEYHIQKYGSGGWYDLSRNPSHTPLWPLVDDLESFDDELHELLRLSDNPIKPILPDGTKGKPLPSTPPFKNRFFQFVALPILNAFFHHKERSYGQALNWCQVIGAPDWKYVCTHWIEKRMRQYESGHPTPQEVK